MNKNFYKNRKMRFFSFTFAFLISIGLIIQNCSMEEDEPLLLDDAIPAQRPPYGDYFPVPNGVERFIYYQGILK